MQSTRRGTFRAPVLAVCLAFVAFSALAQSDVDVETFTNGQNADTAPGPAVTAGSTVNWTYVVTNTGSRPLANISVTDDQGVIVTCPGTTLDAGLSFTCTASGTSTRACSPASPPRTKRASACWWQLLTAWKRRCRTHWVPGTAAGRCCWRTRTLT